MMLSGVGPAAQLQAHGITVVQDLAGVGQNLTDHFGIDIVGELKGHESLDKYNKPHMALWAGLQYALFGFGPVTSNVVEGGAFWYADRGAAKPDLQFHFLCGAGAEAGVPSVPKGSSGVTLNSYTLRPRSRGSVSLRSADPAAVPLVDPALRVHGLDGLRICDSSVMPSLIGSNTNAATIMIGEKAADLIRGNG